MQNKKWAIVVVLEMLLVVWLGGCGAIHKLSTEEYTNSVTGQAESVQKQYLTWEKPIIKTIWGFMFVMTATLAKLANEEIFK